MTHGALCVCGHWDDKHDECCDCHPEQGHGWYLFCRGCGCTNFQADSEAMRDMENEAKQLEWDARRGK